MKEVFDDSKKKWLPAFTDIENQRKKLTANHEKIAFEDFGAGGDNTRKKELLISAIAAKALKQAKYARFLHRLATYIHATEVVELGTSLGITTSYLATSGRNVKVHTVEADASIQKIARQNWASLSIENIQSYLFDLNEKWTLLANQINKIDLLFVDANHRKEAMIRYVLQALPYLHERSVVVLDDIYWNEDTCEAWNILKARKEVTLSFDIFQMGFLFFDPRLSKENFRLKYP
jgi:predicted O-methyltransferase YrrM